jgi:site-specific DNA-adenine methylase
MTCYWAGKKRIADDIATSILKVVDIFDPERKICVGYWEPFLGMGSVMSKLIVPLSNEYDEKLIFLGTDTNKKVIDFWNEIKQGWKPPSFKDGEIDYNDYLNAKDECKKKKKDSISPCDTFIGYSCGFQGQYFKGITRPEKFGSLITAGYNSVMKVADNMSSDSTNFHLIDFFDYDAIEPIVKSGGFIIYMDPPYKCSTIFDYKNSKNSFDIVKFWKCAEFLAKNNLVFVSETEAPSSKWKVIWEKSFNNISNNKKYSRVERLYVCL